MTVVLTAAALRDRGARLSRGFSWEQTIQEVKNEFAEGGVGWPLRHCFRVVVVFGRSGAAVFSRAARSSAKPTATMQFERFVFDPCHLEDTWSADQPGTTFGVASVMAAVFASHFLMRVQPSSQLTVSRGLAAARELHRLGATYDEKGLNFSAAEKKIFAIQTNKPPEKLFRAAFPRELLDEPVLVRKSQCPPLAEQTLLTDALGLNAAFLTVAAEDIVRSGRDRALQSVPRLEWGKYFTVDREEIERLNGVGNLILDYKDNAEDKRPLSLAVFGAPGSGKSFAIEQLSESLFGKDQAVLKFNLSQFKDLDALHVAFHEVRDQSVKGQMPLVFWDEFDSAKENAPLGWLKEFLAPMQDAHFVANGKAHPFGKCIFIFAGGTSDTFASFDRSAHKREKGFRDAKGPDFVSRLRGYVNIKGPNPTTDTGKGDNVYVIRRALLLRTLLERLHKGIVDPITKKIAISPTVLDAFLRVGDGKAGKGYLHGVRSMEAIVSLSRLHRCRHFGPSELPAREVVELHVARDFSQKVQDTTSYHLTPADIERLAEFIHEEWRNAKKAEGYEYAPDRDDDARPPTHPMMQDYGKINEDQKEMNRLPARLIVLRLESLGYRIRPLGAATGKIAKTVIATATLRKLAQSEHRRWMRLQLLEGKAYGENNQDALLLHRDIQKFDFLDDQEKKLDDTHVDAFLQFLKEKRLRLVKN